LVRVRRFDEKEDSVSTEAARRLVFRVASDPELLSRLYRVAEGAEENPDGCAELARLVAELDPTVSLKDCAEVRNELEAPDHDAYRSTHPTLEHDLVAETASSAGMDALLWVRRAAYATANVCTA
jgi:hypothetical protein